MTDSVDPSSAVATLIQVHAARYPEIEIMDVYRLLHHAVFGAGRPVKALKAEREWLEREVEITRPEAGQSILESVHPQGNIVRLHLRPYLAAKGDPRKLLDAYVESSKVTTGDAAQMLAHWAVFQQMIQAGSPFADRFDVRAVRLFGRTRAAESWPASHHSPAILRKYRPVYRIIIADVARKLLEKQKIAVEMI
ncbi:MAG: hypothetical protein KF726_00975 [Anaerolineae bacterium]|nr:hypothetical protein [Anaerolineae bacterium]